MSVVVGPVQRAADTENLAACMRLLIRSGRVSVASEGDGLAVTIEASRIGVSRDVAESIERTTSE